MTTNIKDLFYKPLKINDKEDNIFFWSDLHDGHDRDFIYKPRGFNNVSESHYELIKRWNEKINDSSTVFHLGDIIFGNFINLS